MSKIALLVLAAVSVLVSEPVFAQQKASDVRVVVLGARQYKDSVHVDLEIEIIGAAVAPREQLRLFPAIKLGIQEERLIPVVVNGRTQDRVIKRRTVLSKETDPVYASFSPGRSLFHEKVRYKAAVSLQEWMKDAQVIMVQEMADCRGGFHRLSMEVIAPQIKIIEKPRQDFVYVPIIPFIQPPQEQIKRRTEAGEALIVYGVGDASIRPALGNNSAELDKIRNSIRNIKLMEGAEIGSVSIASYASPDGNWQNNQRLSERRAASLAQWVGNSSDLRDVRLSANGYGEDWKYLITLIEADPVMAQTEKYDLLHIINNTAALDVRETAIRQYNGGAAYRYMLESMFPRLRRSEYRIEYTVPEFTLEKSREVYRTHPQMLSLAELYALANEYEAGSSQFINIFTTAAEYFPEEKVARLNMAAVNLIQDNLGDARQALEGLEEDHQAWIYLGILYAKEGDLDGAESYLRRAQSRGSEEAAFNLIRLAEYREKIADYDMLMKEWEEYGI